jgi:hypothetical protein
MIRPILPLAAMLVLSCGPQPAANEPAPAAGVQSSGKLAVPVGRVPPEVVAVALERVPDLSLASAEAETREGRRYYDLGGTRADGSEIELDIMEEGRRWRVVETQRDIRFEAAPRAVRDAARAHDVSLEPTRVIESRQEDGLVIYELYAPAGGDPQGRKLEIKWDGRQASVLAREWAH